MRIGIWFYHLLLTNFCCIVLYQLVIRGDIIAGIAIFKPTTSDGLRSSGLRVQSSGGKGVIGGWWLTEYRVQRRECRGESAEERVGGSEVRGERSD